MKTPSCPQCHSLYSATIKENGRPGKHPMLLRCGHTFCEDCILKCHVIYDCLICPACQMSTKVGPGKNIQGFVNPDLYAIGLIWFRRLHLELNSQKIMTTGKKKSLSAARPKINKDACCSECQVNTATCRCIKCDCILCQPCFAKIHQTSNTLKKHLAVSLLESGGPRNINRFIEPEKKYCLDHDQCALEYFCMDDCQAICSRCVILGSHKGHSVVTFEEKNKDFMSDLKPAVLDAQEIMWRLEQSEKLLTDSMPSSPVYTGEIIEEIQSHFLGLHSTLQAREEQLIDIVKDSAEYGTKCLKDMKSYIQTEKVKLENMLKEAAYVEKIGWNQVVDAESVLQNLKGVKELPCDVKIKTHVLNAAVKFSFEASMMDNIQSYGHISAPESIEIVSLSVPGLDAEKPNPEELERFTITLPDTDSVSTECSELVSESISDIASVVVEELVDDVVTKWTRVPTSIKTTKDFLVTENPLVPGTCEKVVVTHIRTPAEFYVQLVRREKSLSEMSANIHHYCQNRRGKGKKPLKLVQTGDMVLAQYSEDKVWYRARVLQVMQSRESKDQKVSYKVFFMDYGNTEILPHKKLQKMKEKFMCQPSFSYECCLHDILPADVAVGWAEESVNTMLQMTSAGPLIMIVKSNLGGVLEVDLGRPESEVFCKDERPVSVRDSLVFLEMAIFNTRSPEEHEDFVQNACESKKRQYLPRACIRKDTVIDIGINCVTSPSVFHGQVCSRESVELLNQLMAFMQKTYTDESAEVYRIFCPRKDMVCVAKNEEDGRWYRVQVTGLPGKRKVEVQFVDKGNKQVVDCSDICKIMDIDMRYPKQALECCLADVEPLENGEWSEKAKAWFKSYTEYQRCQLRATTRSRKPNTVEGVLYCIDIETDHLCCINYELVRRGFAKSTGRWSAEECYSGITLSSDQRTRSEMSSPATDASPFSEPYRLGSHSFSTVEGKSFTKHDKQSSAEEKMPVGSNGCVDDATIETYGQTEGTKNEYVDVMLELDKQAVEVEISFYLSPSYFFVRPQDLRKELIQMMKDLQQYEKEPLQYHAWKKGESCVVKRTADKGWYRGLVVDQTEDNKYEICLVDFGCTDIVSVSHLKPLKAAHAELNVFAKQCHLANVIPSGTSDRTVWSKTAKEFFERAIKKKRLFVKVMNKLDPEFNEGLPVDILMEEIVPMTAFEPSYSQYISLLSVMQDKGLVIPVKMGTASGTASPSISAPMPCLYDVKLKPTVNECQVLSDCLSKRVSEADENSGNIVQSMAMVNGHRLCVAPHPKPLSDSLSVCPVYVTPDGHIFAQDVAEEASHTFLREQLNSYMQNSPKDLTEIDVGQLCVAYFEPDSLWYRAVIVELDVMSVRVIYIDYGNEGDVGKDGLKDITAELCSLPLLSYTFRLHNVDVISTGDKSWPDIIMEFMKDSVLNHLCLAYIKNSSENAPIEVDLLLEDGQDVGAQVTALEVQLQENVMEKQYACSSKISTFLKTSNPYSLPHLGEDGELIRGFISNIELPNLVSFQRYQGTSDRMKEELLDFLAMVEDLNKHFSQDCPPPADPDYLPALGDMCCAQFSLDSRWYRGLVIGHENNEMVEVFYVDYGNMEAVHGDRIRPLPQQFQKMPMQSVRAQLCIDLPENTSSWNLTTYLSMSTAIFLKPHLIRVAEVHPFTVELFCPSEMTGQVLSYQKLVDNGLVTVPSIDSRFDDAGELRDSQ